MGDRTLIWDVFDYVLEADRRRRLRIRLIRTYRNPIFLAREWAEAIRAGGFPTRRAFAKAIGVSHARVAQMLGLLKLGPEALRRIEALGDPLSSPMVTERKLRPIVVLPRERQEGALGRMLGARGRQSPLNPQGVPPMVGS